MLVEPFQGAGTGSHFPVLAAAVVRTTGPILELGMGYWSSPMLHLMCKDKRFLASYESNPEWLERFKYLHCYFHLVTDFMPLMMNDTWAVVFVDHAPGEARVPLIAELKGRAHFIVAHDTEADIPPSGGNYGWAKLDGLFKYQTIFKDFRPWTTVYSDVEEFVL